MKAILINVSFCFLLMHAAVAQSFNEVAIQSGIDHLHVSSNYIGGGAVFFDYDNDGLLDIFLTGGTQTDGLFRNMGNGSFQDVTTAAGMGATWSVKSMGAVAGDIDNDGDRDLFVAIEENTPNLLWENMGDGTFQLISTDAGINEVNFSVSATMGDYNLDGYLDIYVGNYTESLGFTFDSTGQVNGFAHSCYPNSLYINNGDKTFTEAAALYGVDDTGCALAAAFTDYDLDHDPDIYLANDFGEFVVPNQTFRNEYPVDAFTDVSTSSGMNIGLYGMGIARGDYDEDGDFDYYVTNLGRNVLLQNDGLNHFSDVTAFAGVENTYVAGKFTTGWGTQFVDVDNDTYLDLFVSNGQVPAAGFIATYPFDPCKLYMNNNGDGTFADVSDSAGVANTDYSRGSAYGDYDNDGDIDLLVTNLYPGVFTRHAFLFENVTQNGNNWLQVKLQGVQTNRDALGALVTLHAGGRTFIREIDGGSSHASCNENVAFFGLGTITTVDSLVITWPGGNQQTEMIDSVNQRVFFIEDLANMTCQKMQATQSTGITTTSVTLKWAGMRAVGGYVIRGKPVAGSTFVQLTVPEPNADTKFVSGLQPATSYEWQIKKLCDSAGTNQSSWSDPDTFTTKCVSPSALATTGVTENSATLNWNPVPGVSGYRILGINVLYPSAIVSIDFPSNITSFSVSNLPTGNTFIWTAISKCTSSGDVVSSILTTDTFTTTTSIQKDDGIQVNAATIRFYPNPATSSIKVVVPEQFKMHPLYLGITSMGGQLVLEQSYPQTPGRSVHQIDLPDRLPHGIYEITFRAGSYIQNSRLVVIR